MGRTVLVADDNLTIQRMAIEILSRSGVEVVTVANGVAAIKKLGSVNPCVVLADADMPGKDGYEVCDFVKSSAEFAHVGALLVVGDADPYDEERAKSARVDGVVKKPFDREQLTAAVGRYIEASEAFTPPVNDREASSAHAEPPRSGAGPVLPADASPPQNHPPEEAAAPAPAAREEEERADEVVTFEAATAEEFAAPPPESGPASEVFFDLGMADSGTETAEGGTSIERVPAESVSFGGASVFEQAAQEPDWTGENRTVAEAGAAPVITESAPAQPNAADLSPRIGEDQNEEGAEHVALAGDAADAFAAAISTEQRESLDPPEVDTAAPLPIPSTERHDEETHSSEQGADALILTPPEPMDTPAEALDNLDALSEPDSALVGTIVRRVLARMAPPALSPEMALELERTLTAEVLSQLPHR